MKFLKISFLLINIFLYGQFSYAMTEQETELWNATHDGDLSLVKKLVEAGTNINIHVARRKTTPLQSAALNGHFEVVKYLVEHGADINAQDDRGNSPLHDACIAKNNRFEIVKYLINKGANVNIQNKQGVTPLNIVCGSRGGNLDLAKLLVESGANINAKTNRGETPLQRAQASNLLNKTEKEKIVAYLKSKSAQ